jgi:hypothetical protein
MGSFFSVTEADRWDGQTGYSGNNRHWCRFVPVARSTGIPLFLSSRPTYDNRHRVPGVHNADRIVTKCVCLAIRRYRWYPRESHREYRSRSNHWRSGAHRAHDRWCIRVRMPLGLRYMGDVYLNVSIFTGFVVTVWSYSSSCGCASNNRTKLNK